MRALFYYLPSSLEDAYLKLNEDPQNAILGGGMWMKKTGQSYNTIIDLKDLSLDYIKEDEEKICIGSYATFRQIETSPLIASLMGGFLVDVLKQILGPAFRNSATIGGTIVGRYPFSDLITALMGLDVELVFYPEQRISLNDYLSYKGKINGILKEIVIKKENGKAFFKKVKTNSLDFALLNICIVKKNGLNYIAVGSRPMVATFAIKAMAEANTSHDYEKASLLAADELSFLDSTLISKDYRKDLTRVYVLRGLKEVNR